MIEVELADGTVLEIDAADQATAVQAARKYMQSRAPQPAPAAPPVQGVEPSPYVPLERTPAVPRDRLVPEADSYYLEPNQGPTPPTTMQQMGQGLARGAQVTGQGLANAAGAPVDIASLIVNAPNLLAGREAPIQDPIGGSASIKNLVGQAASALGFPFQDTEHAQGPQRLLDSAQRMATEALAGGQMLRRLSGAAPASRTAQALAAPYEDAIKMQQGARPLLGDVAGGAGSGVAVSGVETMYPDNPLASLAASLAGGVGGTAALGLASAPAKTTRSVIEFNRADRNIPLDSSGNPTTVRVANEARRQAQEAANNPTLAARNIGDELAVLRANDVTERGTPTAGLLSNDPGLIGRERSLALKAIDPRLADRLGVDQISPGDFIEKARGVRSDAAERVGSLNPGESVDTRTAQQYARQSVDQQLDAARQPVRRAERSLADAEADQANLAAATGARREMQGPASERLDTAVVEKTMKPMAAEQSKRYGAIDPEGTVQRPPDAMVDVASRLEQAAADLPPSLRSRVLPEELVNDLKALAPKAADETVPMGFVPQADAAPAEPASVTFKAMNRMRPLLAEAEKEARKSGKFQLADNLRAVKQTIEREAETLAAEGGDAGVRAQQALEYTRNEFGPRFGTGEGSKLRKDINRDDLGRTNTPPTATAERFLKPGSGGKEVAADLKRILSGSPAEGEGRDAAREYLLADMAKVVRGGKINPESLRTWIANRQGVFEVFPEFKAEADNLLRDVVNKRENASQLAADLQAATGKLKLTERQISDSGLSLLLDADPKVAAADVFKSRDPQMKMREITNRLRGDKDATEAWKKAVVEHLTDTVTNATRQGQAEGERAISFAKMDNLFQQHRKTLVEAGFSPKEMNTLATAHRQLTLMERQNMQVAPGSPTFERLISDAQMRNVEVGLKFWYGMLKGGGINRSIKVLMPNLPGYNDAEKAQVVMQRASLNPELMKHLLETPAPGPSARRWNSRLNQLMGLQQAGAETTD